MSDETRLKQARNIYYENRKAAQFYKDRLQDQANEVNISVAHLASLIRLPAAFYSNIRPKHIE